MAICSHDIIYQGVINLLDDGQPIGAVDVWRCRRCRSMYVDEKRFSDAKPETKVGLIEIERDAKWAVLACRGRGGLAWSLVTIRPGHKVIHGCGAQEAPLELTVQPDFTLSAMEPGGKAEHSLYLIEDHVNRALEMGS